MNLMNYFISFVGALHLQLTHDQKRWGDEWKNRGYHGEDLKDCQEYRIFARIQEYYNEWFATYLHGETGDMPWLKIAGLAFIAWVRQMFPDTYND